MFIIQMNSGARGEMRRRGRVTPMVRTVVKMFVQGVDTTGAPRVEASLQASLIHTSASLVSSLHRDPFNIKPKALSGSSPQTTMVPRYCWITSFRNYLTLTDKIVAFALSR